MMMSWKAGMLGVLFFSGGFRPCSERNDSERNDSERNDSERNDSERNDSERNEPPAPVVAEAPAPAAPEAERQRLPKQQTPTAKAYMAAHFAEAEVMRRALIGGRLMELKAAAAGLAGDEWSANLRPTWKAHVTDVREAARAVNGATSLPEGAEALSKLGRACASCHGSVGAPPPVAPMAAPAKDDSRPMLEHAQAEEWLWRGLAFPSDAAWTSGAQALRRVPAIGSDAEEVARAIARLQSLAERAELAQEEERPRLYAEIVATCASCHQRVGVKL